MQARTVNITVAYLLLLAAAFVADAFLTAVFIMAMQKCLSYGQRDNATYSSALYS